MYVITSMNLTEACLHACNLASWLHCLKACNEGDRAFPLVPQLDGKHSIPATHACTSSVTPCTTPALQAADVLPLCAASPQALNHTRRTLPSPIHPPRPIHRQASLDQPGDVFRATQTAKVHADSVAMPTGYLNW